MSRRVFWLLTIVIGLVFLICLLPVIAAFSAAMIADANDCVLHEGFANPCWIWGADRGQLLVLMFVSGWLGLATLPIAAIALLVWLVLLVVYRYAQRARKLKT